MTARRYPRFSRGQRLQHAVLILSFTALALTGLPQKYTGAVPAERTIAVLGGIEAVRIAHRVAALVLILATLYHFFDVAYRVLVRGRPLSMLPRREDALHFWQTLGHNLGWSRGRPRMGRFTFEEKIEYWALIWGTLIMSVTGFALLNPIATTRFVPGQLIPAALAAHGGEAVLAVLAVIVWHGYGVHLRHFNRSMFTGSLSEEEMQADHPQELAAIVSGSVPPEPAAELLSRRRAVFLPIAALLSILLLAGLYVFASFEQTAITTLPRGR